MTPMTPESKLKGDFSLFLRLIWRSLALPEPTRAQLAMARYLQHGGPRIQLQCFRGLGKSWVTAAFVIWNLYVDRDKKILVVSASKIRADEFAIFCQRCITDIPWLSHLAPEDSDTRWSRVSFDVRGCKPAQSPSVKSVGIGGQMAGARADLIIADDVEIPANSATDLMREKLLQLVTEFESILMPLPTSRIIFLGTPQSVFTIYRTLKERHYIPMVWPARYPKEENMINYDGCLAKELLDDIQKHGLTNLVGKPTDTRFSDRVLSEKELSMSRSNFMLQFQLNTTLSDELKFPLKLSDIPAMPLDALRGPSSVVWRADKAHLLDEPAVSLPGDRWYAPAETGESLEWRDTLVAIDPSGRGKDETVAVVLSQLNGLIFIRDIYASTDGYSDKTLRAILTLAKQYKATRAVIESNFGDGMVMELMKRHGREMDIPLHYEEVRASVRKEDRILDTLEPVMNQHRLIIDQRLIKEDYHSNQDMAPEERLPRMLMYQLSRMCREKGAVKHDDRVDALALGVKWFTDILAISADVQNKDRKQQEFLDLLGALEREPTRALDSLVLGARPEHFKTLSGGGILSWD